MSSEPGSAAQIGRVMKALERAVVIARAASDSQRDKIRRARVAGTYLPEMLIDLHRIRAFEEGVCHALLVAQEADAGA